MQNRVPNSQRYLAVGLVGLSRCQTADFFSGDKSADRSADKNVKTPLLLLGDCPSVRLPVYPSNACILTKRKKDLSRLLYRTKDHLA